MSRASPSADCGAFLEVLSVSGFLLDLQKKPWNKCHFVALFRFYGETTRRVPTRYPPVQPKKRNVWQLRVAKGLDDWNKFEEPGLDKLTISQTFTNIENNTLRYSKMVKVNVNVTTFSTSFGSQVLSGHQFGSNFCFKTSRKSAAHQSPERPPKSPIPPERNNASKWKDDKTAPHHTSEKANGFLF